MQRTLRGKPSRSVLEASGSPLPSEAAPRSPLTVPESRIGQPTARKASKATGLPVYKGIMLFIAGGIFGALCMGLGSTYLAAEDAGSHPLSGRKAELYKQLATSDCSRFAKELGDCKTQVVQQGLLEEKLGQTQEALAGAKRKLAEALAGAKGKLAEAHAHANANAQVQSQRCGEQTQRLEEYTQQCKTDVEGCKDELSKLTWNAAACIALALVVAAAIGFALPSLQARHWHTAVTRLKAENLELKGRHRWQ
ncbi:hypothetical protein WJX73_001789 [Symbiochloris irregularis]|uniref:Uncharacterized protein n=1 Tax=Symbiochloris irregularis TaxID=706552 RepID=A0AAW1P5P8_9CHLO